METTLMAWRPGLGMTAFDDSQNYMGERLQGWYVIAQNRDSDALERSNFACIARDLQAAAEKAGVPDCVEQHHFGHWAVGWVDQLVLTRDAPESVVREAEAALKALQYYPIYDEDHFSDLEWNEAADYWDGLSPREKVRMAIEERQRRHWTVNTPVWRFGRMDFGTLANDGSEIAESIYESLRG